MPKTKPIRIEQIMVESGMAPSVERARALIMAGDVFIGQSRVESGARKVDPETEIVVKGAPQFVSRAGFKLEHALKTFNIDVNGRVCADVGAATGGFSDAMLQRGAEKVFAVDVGYGDLHWKVRSDPRVVPIERTNARYLEILPERVSLIAVDVSFISVTLLLENFGKWLTVGGDLLILIKPQFEATREEVESGLGIIEDADIHRRILEDTLRSMEEERFTIQGLIASPITGMHGNREYLVWLKSGDSQQSADFPALIAAVIPPQN